MSEVSNVIAIRSYPALVQFRNYVLSFYAYDGIYPIEELSVAKVEKSIQQYIELCASPKNHFEWGDGDSLDRERVRDIILQEYQMLKEIAKNSCISFWQSQKKS